MVNVNAAAAAIQFAIIMIIYVSLNYRSRRSADSGIPNLKETNGSSNENNSGSQLCTHGHREFVLEPKRVRWYQGLVFPDMS